MTQAGNFVYQTTTGTGAGNIDLSAVSGFRAFATVFGTTIANKFYYGIRNTSNGEFEVGIGYMSDADTLVRDSVIESSNSNNLVNFSAGTKQVISDIPANIQNLNPAYVPYTGAASNVDLGVHTITAGGFIGNASTATALATSRSIYGNNFDGTANLSQIIASTFGGTGNGFTKFSGPASTEKTFTLPNASATILTTNTAVTIAQGGTGATTANAAHNNLLPSQTGLGGRFLQTNGTNSSWALAVTSVATGTGLTGGTITSTGTISMATGTANTLAGYGGAGAFSGVAIGSGLSLSGGTLSATGTNYWTLDGSNNIYNNNTSFGGSSGRVNIYAASGTDTGQHYAGLNVFGLSGSSGGPSDPGIPAAFFKSDIIVDTIIWGGADGLELRQAWNGSTFNSTNTIFSQIVMQPNGFVTIRATQAVELTSDTIVHMADTGNLGYVAVGYNGYGPPGVAIGSNNVVSVNALNAIYMSAGLHDDGAKNYGTFSIGLDALSISTTGSQIYGDSNATKINITAGGGSLANHRGLWLEADTGAGIGTSDTTNYDNPQAEYANVSIGTKSPYITRNYLGNDDYDIAKIYFDGQGRTSFKGLRGVFLPNFGSAGTVLPSSPDTGEIVFDTDSGAPYYWNGSSWVSMAGAAGAQTPWVANIDADHFDLNNVNKIAIDTTGSSVTGLDFTGLGYFGPSYSAGGLSWFLGYNTTGNRQMWLGDPSGLGSGGASFFRYFFLSGVPVIDGVDGTNSSNKDISICPYSKVFIGASSDDSSGKTLQVTGGINSANDIAASGAINPNIGTTVVNCSTSGTVTFSQPFRGSALKRVQIRCAAALGTASYTFPVAFSFTPVILTTSGLAGSLITSLSTTAVTVTGATSTGSLFLEGY